MPLARIIASFHLGRCFSFSSCCTNALDNSCFSMSLMCSGLRVLVKPLPVSPRYDLSQPPHGTWYTSLSGSWCGGLLIITKSAILTPLDAAIRVFSPMSCCNESVNVELGNTSRAEMAWSSPRTLGRRLCMVSARRRSLSRRLRGYFSLWKADISRTSLPLGNVDWISARP